MSYDLEPSDQVPYTVRAAQSLLFVEAVFAAAVIIKTIVTFGASAEILGRLLWACWPGAVGLVVALRIDRGGKRLFWAAVVVSAFWIVGALASLGQKEPRGFAQLVIPVSLVVVLTRPSVRKFFHRT